MEDENSCKAVTLLPAVHAVAATDSGTPPPAPVSPTTANNPLESATPRTAMAAPADSTFASAHLLHEARGVTTPPPPVAARGQEVYVESDSNEEPLFQHPPSSMASPLLLPGSGAALAWGGGGMRPWSAVSATPPSAYFNTTTTAAAAAAAGGGGVVGGQFPSCALHADVASTPLGQALPVGRDLSNRHSTALATAALGKDRTTTTAAAPPPPRSSALTATYVDSSNSESFSSSSLGALGRHGSLSGAPTAHRSLFRYASGPGSPLATAASAAAAAPCTPVTPALTGESVLFTEPPTPAKQRRTIHGGRGSAPQPGLLGLSNAADNNSGYYLGQRVPSSTAAAASGGAVSPGKQAPLRSVAPLVMPPQAASASAVARLASTSPSLPRNATTPATAVSGQGSGAGTTAPSLTFKFHRREGSRKRSADVLSQFSALDLDETPATPYGQTALPGRFHSLGAGTAFPSQPSTSLRGGAGGGAAGTYNGSFGPTSPLMVGYATPVTLSQQIGGSNTFSQLLLHPSQDALEMSQADTECSNFLARRIVNDFHEVRLLGRGSFGTVSLYKEISSGELVAVKVSPPLRGPEMERRYRRERSVMGMVRGMPHLVQLSAAWEEGRVPRMYLQIEYCPGGCVAALAAAKQARREQWPEAEVKVFLAHMCIALDAMHRADIAHVDFKPDNVLIDRDGAYKLSDFGCSVLLDANGRPRAETANGYGGAASSPSSRSPQHGGHGPQQMQRGGGVLVESEDGGVSPMGDQQQQHRQHRQDAAETVAASAVDFHWKEGNEASNASVDEGDCRYLCADMLNEKRYCKAGDMFSLGISLYELMSGQPLPRNGDQFLALRRQVPVEMLRRRGYSASLVRLVAALMDSEPTQRPTARQVLQYLRPSPAELQLLADATEMQRWTTSATSFQQQQQQQQPACDEERGNATTGTAAALVATPAALRCVSALVEASCWLLTTTQQELHRSLAQAAADGADEEAEQQQQQRREQARSRYHQGLRVPPRSSHMPHARDLEQELEGLPMSPVMRDEACTPTTLQY